MIDPESGLDGVRSVAITGKKITAISTTHFAAKSRSMRLDLWLHPASSICTRMARRPRTIASRPWTALRLRSNSKIGVYPASEWYLARAGKSLIHYGASSGHVPARMAVMKDTGMFLPRDSAMKRPASPDEQQAILSAVEKGLDEGALGMGLGLTYTPTATPGEVLDLFYLMGKWKRPVFVHLRNTAMTSPGIIESLQEMIADAAIFGAPLHIVHINSSGLKRTAAGAPHDRIGSRPRAGHYHRSLPLRRRGNGARIGPVRTGLAGE